jgi:TolA-binding protein
LSFLKMNNKISFDSETCLTTQELFAYAQAQSNAAITRRVELHIADCPLCSDALEGLQIVDNENFIHTHRTVNLLLKEKYNPTKVITMYSVMRWAAAASIAAFLIGFGWWNYSQKAQNEAIAKNEIETEITIPSTDSSDAQLATIAQDNLSPQKNKIPKGEKLIVPKENRFLKNTTVLDSDGEDDIGASTSSVNVPSPPVLADEQPVSPTTTPTPTATEAAPKIEKPRETAQTEAVAVKDKQDTYDDIEPKMNTYHPNPAKLPSGNSQDVGLGYERKNKKEEVGKVKAEKAKSTANAKRNIEFSDLDEKKLMEGIALYQKNKPREALVIFEELLKKDADNQNALFYKGASLALNEQYMEAITVLSPFATAYPEGSAANAEATWISANCYVKLQQKESAKILLHQLIDFYNPRQDDAKRLLEKLN